MCGAVGVDRVETVVNGPAGFPKIIEYFRSHGVTRVGIESTGIYHREVTRALRAAGFTVDVLQPKQVKAYAQFRLQRAKSDAIDAKLIARCTADLDRPCRVHDPRLEAFAERLTMLDQLVEDVACLKTRRESFRDPHVLDLLNGQIAALEKVIAAERKTLMEAVKKHADLKRRYALLESIRGIGDKTALMLVIRMPELGDLTREEAASLLGVAPFVHQSGKYEGLRRTGGGRARARTALFAATQAAIQWNPALKALYGRLIANGKAHAVAIIACVRKLIVYANTVLARGTPWVQDAPLPTTR